ncbi:Sodium channel protein para [Lamellibrachia satsuma]|nr:Sodium channel protein para [Lamellibrachia satsuma]
MFVMIVILVNCVFMASNQDVPHSELIFTIIYTMEGTTKMLSRGFILHSFSYLRDAWNWLDFVVVVLA